MPEFLIEIRDGTLIVSFDPARFEQGAEDIEFVQAALKAAIKPLIGTPVRESQLRILVAVTIASLISSGQLVAPDMERTLYWVVRRPN